jgi:alanine racemase
MTSSTTARPGSAWIEVSLDNLLHNLGEIRRLAGAGTGIIAVVKDCAYGCGAVPVAQLLETAGVALLAVARFEEARHLRANGIRHPILVIGEAPVDELAWAWGDDIHVTVNSLRDLREWSRGGHRVRAHLNVDTGMSRMGVSLTEVAEAAAIIASSPSIHLEGGYTHFACADDPATDTVERQYVLFGQALEALSRHDLAPPLLHVSNTAALTRFPVPEGYLVRPGVALYGCLPHPGRDFGLALRPVVSLKGRVLSMRRLAGGTPVSYGGTYTTPRETCIATVNIGYAHGLPRLASNRGSLLVNGKRYPIAGTVTMDYTMIDAGPTPHIERGDEVVAVGQQADERIDADEMARWADTIGYEILCGLSGRIERVYLHHGHIIHRTAGVLY